jgi:hypothetical protein
VSGNAIRVSGVLAQALAEADPAGGASDAACLACRLGGESGARYARFRRAA